MCQLGLFSDVCKTDNFYKRVDVSEKYPKSTNEGFVFCSDSTGFSSCLSLVISVFLCLICFCPAAPCLLPSPVFCQHLCVHTVFGLVSPSSLCACSSSLFTLRAASLIFMLLPQCCSAECLNSCLFKL